MIFCDEAGRGEEIFENSVTNFPKGPKAEIGISKPFFCHRFIKNEYDHQLENFPYGGKLRAAAYGEEKIRVYRFTFIPLNSW